MIHSEAIPSRFDQGVELGSGVFFHPLTHRVSPGFSILDGLGRGHIGLQPPDQCTAQVDGRPELIGQGSTGKLDDAIIEGFQS